MDTLIAPQRREILVNALKSVIPNVVVGTFTLTNHHTDRVPVNTRDVMAGFEGWSVMVYAIPITDDGLWVWHQHGDYRSLMANYVLARAHDSARRAAAVDGFDLVSLTEATANGVSMVEVGEIAGIGTRGWNNLLLHPEYGSWMQIEAFVTATDLGRDSGAPVVDDVCIKCMNCINDCPARAISVDDFRATPCAKLVAAPWNPRSRAVALTAHSYIECRVCITSCPIGTQSEGIFEWQR